MWLLCLQKTVLCALNVPILQVNSIMLKSNDVQIAKITETEVLPNKV